MLRTSELPSETIVTTDHDEIRRWAAHHRARPVQVLGSGDVTLDLPEIDPRDRHAEVARPVDWDEWFAAFETWKLAFLYQSRRADGEVPTYNAMVSR